jgi:tyrosine-protein phosphatase YwqE
MRRKQPRLTAEQVTILLTALSDYLERQEVIAHDIEAVMCIADDDEVALMEFDLNDVRRRISQTFESIAILRSLCPEAFPSD